MLREMSQNYDEKFLQLSRDLLSSKNKAELLDAAKTNALFDKDNKYMVLDISFSKNPVHRCQTDCQVQT